MTTTAQRNNKARAKVAERRVAAMLGGKRHLADTGGPEDVKHDLFAVQVKSGLKVVNDTIRTGIASAKAAAVGTAKMPILVVEDRAGTRLAHYVVIEMSDFQNEFGLPGSGGEE